MNTKHNTHTDLNVLRYSNTVVTKVNSSPMELMYSNHKLGPTFLWL